MSKFKYLMQQFQLKIVFLRRYSRFSQVQMKLFFAQENEFLKRYCSLAANAIFDHGIIQTLENPI